MSVAFCGLKSSGKTRASKVMQENGYKRLSFAGPLKEILGEWSGSVNIFYDPELKEQPLEDPDFLDNSVKFLGELIFIKLGMSEFGARQRLRQEAKTPIGHLRGMTGEAVLADLRDMVGTWIMLQDEGMLTPRIMLQELGTDYMRKWNSDIHVNMFETNHNNDLQGKFVVDDARFENELEVLSKHATDIIWLHRPSVIATDFHNSETSIGNSDCSTMVRSEEAELLDRSVQFYVDKGHFPQEVVI